MSPYRMTYGKMNLIVMNWQLIADKYHGHFRNILSKSPAIIDPIDNEIRRFEMQIQICGETIILTASENHYFKLDYKFRKKFDFEIQIYPEDFIEKMSKLFGLKELEIGNSNFDNKYIIKSNNDDIARKILNETIQDNLTKFELVSLQLTSDKDSQLMILPYINEENYDELNEFIIFSKQLIERIIEINNGCQQAV
jgi:hypothetical protein